MNFIFAVLAFWCMFIVGIPGLTPVIGQVEKGSIAAVAELREGDRILAVNGNPVATWEGAVLGLLDAMLEGSEVELELRDDEGAGRFAVLDIDNRLAELTEPGALLPGIGLQVWAPRLAAEIGEVAAGGAADSAGMQAGDRVTRVDGETVADWEAWVDFVRARPGVAVAVEVLRDEQLLMLEMTIGEQTLENGEKAGLIGARVYVPEGLYDEYRAEQRYQGFEAFSRAVGRTWDMSALTVRMVSRMVTGDVSPKNISGPINIAQYAGYTASIGLASFLSFLAVVSLSLGILNLLPIPVLDGGQIVYQVAEAIKGKPLSERVQILGQQIGIAFLVLIMGFAFYNDLSRVFS